MDLSQSPAILSSRSVADRSPQGIERVVLSGSVSLDAAGNCAQGLNFRQFVDALSRCGLVGFSNTGVIGGTAHEKKLVSAAERAQAIFKTQMRLLDKQHVAAKLQKLADLPPAILEATAGVEGTAVEGPTRSKHGHTAGDGNGTKKANTSARGSTKRGTRRDGGKKAATAADPKPTPRGEKR